MACVEKIRFFYYARNEKRNALGVGQMKYLLALLVGIFLISAFIVIFILVPVLIGTYSQPLAVLYIVVVLAILISPMILELWDDIS